MFIFLFLIVLLTSQRVLFHVNKVFRTLEVEFSAKVINHFEEKTLFKFITFFLNLLNVQIKQSHLWELAGDFRDRIDFHDLKAKNFLCLPELIF